MKLSAVLTFLLVWCIAGAQSEESIRQDYKAKRAFAQAAAAREAARRAQEDVDDLKAQLAKLENAAREAKSRPAPQADGTERTSISPGAMAIVAQLQEADRLERQRAQIAAEIRQREAQIEKEPIDLITQSKDRALAAYPILANSGSMERLALEGYIARARLDPRYESVFANPKWPELITAEFAALYKLNATGR